TGRNRLSMAKPVHRQPLQLLYAEVFLTRKLVPRSVGREYGRRCRGRAPGCTRAVSVLRRKQGSRGPSLWIVEQDMRDLWRLAARSGQKSSVLVADAAAEIAVNRPHGFQIHHDPILPNDRALDRSAGWDRGESENRAGDSPRFPRPHLQRVQNSSARFEQRDATGHACPALRTTNSDLDYLVSSATRLPLEYNPAPARDIAARIRVQRTAERVYAWGRPRRT